MPVVIIEENEQLKKVIDGATFYYKRVPGHVRNRLMTRYANKRTGTVNWGAYGEALMEAGLTGWSDVVDKAGAQIPFSKEAVPYLPDRVQGDLIDLLGENIEKQEDDIKNSPATPSSSS